MAAKATTRPTGAVNNIEVVCRKCAAKLFVHPDHAKRHGGWECPHCHTRH